MTVCEETSLKEEKYHLNFVIPLIIFYTVTALTSTILNFLVILTVWKTPSLQTPSRILLCSLALTDFLVGCLIEPSFVAACVLAVLRSCSEFDAVYHAASRLGYALGAISMVTLAGISVDRFLAIKTKNNYKTIVTRKRTLMFLAFLWTVPGPAVFLVRYFKTNDNNDTKFVILVVGSLLFVITVFYTLSFYHLRKLSSPVGNTSNPPSAETAPDFNILKYKRSLVTMIMILTLILASYLPIVALLSTRSLSELLDDPGLLHLCESFVILNSTLNPLLYLWKMKSLRQAVKSTLSRS